MWGAFTYSTSLVKHQKSHAGKKMLWVQQILEGFCWRTHHWRKRCIAERSSKCHVCWKTWSEDTSCSTSDSKHTLERSVRREGGLPVTPPPSSNTRELVWKVRDTMWTWICTGFVQRICITQHHPTEKPHQHNAYGTALNHILFLEKNQITLQVW